jgi:hypothetical protein
MVPLRWIAAGGTCLVCRAHSLPLGRLYGASGYLLPWWACSHPGTTCWPSVLCPPLPWPCIELDFRVLIKSGPDLCGVICSSQPGYTAHLMNLLSFLSFRKLMQVLKQHWTLDSPRGSGTLVCMLSHIDIEPFTSMLWVRPATKHYLAYDLGHLFPMRSRIPQAGHQCPRKQCNTGQFLSLRSSSGMLFSCLVKIILLPVCLKNKPLWSHLCSFWRRIRRPQISLIFICIPV